MERKIRLVVCDMDGTLLNSDKIVSKDNYDAILKLKERGVMFTVCTGRIQPMTEYYLKSLNLTTPIITANGALIWDPVSKSTLWEKRMDPEEAVNFLQYCKEHCLDYCALTMECSYFSKNSVRRKRFEHYNLLARNAGMNPMRLKEFDQDFEQIKKIPIYKILVYEVENGQLELVKQQLKKYRNTFYTSSEKGLLDISCKGVSKGEALEQLSTLLEIGLEEVCAMGDFENDISMLKKAGYSVAMGNGEQNVKEVAKYTTRTNDESGVYWAIKDYLKFDF